MQLDLRKPVRVVLGSFSRATLFSVVLPRRINSRRSPPRILFMLPTLAAILFLVSCASSNSSRTVQPPILSYAASNAVYTRGTAITPNTPTDSGGTATSYSVSPALPAGLSLNSATGVISGTPTAVTALTTYMVTASNAGGSGSVSLMITVNDIAPAALTYSVNPATYAVAAAIAPDTPSWSSAGGTPTSFAGALPQGLSVDPTTGVISGTPAAQSAQAGYSITASNTGGSTSATVSITVLPQAPYIITQPASQTVAGGISTYFAVNAGGGGILSYQWYKNAVAISGDNSDVYGTPVLTSADNGEQFYVVVSDNYGRSVTSNVATLTIKGVSGTFVNTGTPSIARDCHTATLLQNGMVLITGGRNGNIPLSSAELYDPTTGNFTATGSLVTSRCAHSATLLQNGTVLIAGGYNFGNSNSLPTLSSAEIYDPTSGTFSATGSLVTSRTGHSATLLPSGKVLVAGGASTTDGYMYFTLASAELYDPAARTFSATGSLNTARTAPATLLNNGQVLVTGGSSLGAGGPFASAEIYDPTAGTFSLTGSLVTARSGHTSTLLQDGKVLIAGGSGADNAALFGELYDPSAGTFSDTGSLNFGRSGHAAILLTNGQVLLVGGGVSSQQLMNISELYDPASGLFILDAPTNYSRFFLSATLLNNGQVLVTGQETSAITITPPDHAELYEP